MAFFSVPNQSAFCLLKWDGPVQPTTLIFWCHRAIRCHFFKQFLCSAGKKKACVAGSLSSSCFFSLYRLLCSVIAKLRRHPEGRKWFGTTHRRASGAVARPALSTFSIWLFNGRCWRCLRRASAGSHHGASPEQRVPRQPQVRPSPQSRTVVLRRTSLSVLHAVETRMLAQQRPPLVR